MRVGVDGRKIPGAADHTPVQILEHAVELGMEGVYFRSVLDLTPTLDLGVLREVRARADELGLYLQMGLAKVNPYAAAEAPEVRVLGEGDYTRGMQRMIVACREGAGVDDLWVACANYKPQLPGYYAFDRFRTDAPWGDQLVAIDKFLKLLAPTVRDLGCHLNVETHEEITSYEVVRLVESVGPDVMGITFDTANVVARGEDPLAAAARVAPYTRATHLRDVALGDIPGGLGRVFLPCGEGVIDWSRLLTELHKANPDLPLSIECAGSSLVMPIDLDDPTWVALHPDLDPAEVAELRRLGADYAQQVTRGERLGLDDLTRRPYDGEAFVRESARHLRDALAGIGAA